MKTRIVSIKSRMNWGFQIARLTVLVLLLAELTGCASSSGSVLTQDLSEPLGGATIAKIEIDPGDGNLTVDTLALGAQELVSGTLQYLENQDQPTHTVDASSSPAAVTLRASPGKQPWIRLPWSACNGATDWSVHLNPGVISDLTAHTDGGNVKLDLARVSLTHLAADAGGGNISVVLPDRAADLNAIVKTGAGDVLVEFGSITGNGSITASSGAGNVKVRMPGNIAARIHTNSGMGKILIDSRFSKIDDTTYQSSSYDSAADRVEITVRSGAGNVTIETY